MQEAMTIKNMLANRGVLRWRHQRGQSLVEMAVALIVLVPLAAGIIRESLTYRLQ